MLLIGCILNEQTMIGTLQILYADFQLFVDLEAGIIHFTQRCRMFLQILQGRKDKRTKAEAKQKGELMSCGSDGIVSHHLSVDRSID